jgi:ATP diphosphatase
MTRAIKLQEKAARVGFDWPSVSPVIEKVKEEIAELEGALRAGGGEGGSPASEEATDEFGDLLFVMANLARHLQIDAEAALRRANDKFCRRFAHIEARLGDRGTSPSQSTLQEMDALWDEAKSAEKDARA